MLDLISFPLAGPSSNLPMMDWSESSIFSVGLKAACARRVHREIKKNLITANVSRPCEMGLGRLGLAEEHDHCFRAQGRLGEC
jgi:hypothetical protein